MKIISNTSEETSELKINSLKTELSNSDKDFIRVLDDIISLLESNGIDISKLPSAVLSKINKRKDLRKQLSDLGG